MTESFPRQQARTRRFTLGVPRTFRISPDGSRIAFLRSRSGSDPLTCLWVLDLASGKERLVADPAAIGADEADLPPEEKARRERAREQAGGIVSYAADSALRTAVFSLSGRVFAVDLSLPAGGADAEPAGPRELAVQTPALDPRPDPDGRWLAYVSGGTLRVASLGGNPIGAPGAGAGADAPGDTTAADAGDRAVASPGDAPGVTFGLAEFIAAEEMERTRGYWWAPDGTALLVARVDETPVMRWHIADPANPERSPAEIAYPAAGTPNADVSLVLADLEGRHTPVNWDRAAFPYLVTACWEDEATGPDPLIVVQSRDQRRMRILTVSRATGATSVLREDTDPHWLDIVPGVPAWTAGGRIAWTADADGARRLLVATPAELSGHTAQPVTPPSLQVREILGVDGDTVLFTASAEPTEIGLWSYGPSGLAEISEGKGLFAGRRAGGTTLITGRSLDEDGVTVQVLRDADGKGVTAARIATFAERPNLPVPRPVLLSLGRREIRGALLFPSWHELGSGKLPVLLDPYGGPHAQRVLAARDAYLTSQWFAEQGFAVLVADGRGTPSRGPAWDRAVAGDLAGPVLEDQVDALHAAAEHSGDLDLSRVGIRGWSFGGYLSALAVLRRPDVFHAAVAGAPVTEWRLYDTHYTERYLGHPDSNKDAYDACSLIEEPERLAPAGTPGNPAPGQGGTAAPATGGPGHVASGPGAGRAVRPLMLIHGLADDNVAVAHTLRLSSALLAAGYPHTVLPLSGVTHMTPQEVVAENLLLLQLDFLRRSLGVAGVQA
ncbi:MAG TPA: prolyl oligopeptidase family serine peptidase [Streptosporangiaceae bacterium]|jgi:dipeptidyl-peptidase-4|nr:prolyl oligopeptidase family serine peptidase [Streptosporangiaceae bacterium]